MAVVIGEIVTEVVLDAAAGAAPAVGAAGTPPGAAAAPVAGSAGLDDEVVERVVRRATERVLDVLRREWDR